MIREMMYELYSNLRLIIGSGAVVVLYIASAIFITRDPGQKRENLPLLLCPIVAIGTCVVRLFELIREKISQGLPQKAAAIFAVCLTALAITSSGTCVFSQELSSAAENDMHIPGGILEAVSAVKADSSNACVLTMPGWDAYFSGYSSEFDLPYRAISNDMSEIADEDARILKAELSDHSPDMKKVSRIAGKKGCTYLVLSKDLWPEVPVTKFGYEQMLECDGCVVYRKVESH